MPIIIANNKAAGFIRNPDTITKEALKQAIQEDTDRLMREDIGTVYELPCIVTIFRRGKLIATGIGNQQFISKEWQPTKKKLINITIGEAVDTRLVPYVNQTLTRQNLTQLLKELYK